MPSVLALEMDRTALEDVHQLEENKWGKAREHQRSPQLE